MFLPFYYKNAKTITKNNNNHQIIDWCLLFFLHQNLNLVCRSISKNSINERTRNSLKYIFSKKNQPPADKKTKTDQTKKKGFTFFTIRLAKVLNIDFTLVNIII